MAETPGPLLETARTWVRVAVEASRVQFHCGTARVICCAGMPRSGSTLVYNIARLCARARYRNGASACWIGDLFATPVRECLIVKTHDIRFPLRVRAGLIIYSYRDIRDVLVSYSRMFGSEPNAELCDRLMASHALSLRRADVVVKYEWMMADLQNTIVTIARAMGVEVDPTNLITELPRADSRRIDHDYDKETLMHGSHGTGTSPGEWRDLLPGDLQHHIARKYHDWLVREGYPIA